MSYYTAIRSASPRRIAAMYNPSGAYQKAARRASPANLKKMIQEEKTRVRYVVLHGVNKRAKQIANAAARNRNIKYVQNSLRMYTQTLKVARNQNWSNHDGRLYSYFPYPRLTLKKLIYYLKQHLKSLELAQHLAGRVVAERMMAKAMANFRGVNATRVKPKNVKN